MHYDVTTAQTEAVTKQFSRTDALVVSPHQNVKATFTVFEVFINATWETNFTINGCAHAMFYFSVNDHNHMWVPVDQIYGKVEGFKCWNTQSNPDRPCDSSFCTFTAQGIYRGIAGAHEKLYTENEECSPTLFLL